MGWTPTLDTFSLNSKAPNILFVSVMPTAGILKAWQSSDIRAIGKAPSDNEYSVVIESEDIYNFYKIFFDQAIKNISDDPKRYIILFLKKVLSFLFIDINSSEDNYYNFLHYLPVLFFGISSLFGIILYDKKSLKINYLILIYFTYVFIFSCFFILPRYKLIILPLQIIFSNFLIVYFYKKFFYRKGM